VEKRAAERVSILGELRADVMVFQPILVSDVSHTGATVETRFPMQIDSLHELRLTLGDKSIVVKARVVHSHISDVDQVNVVYQTGLQFVEPSARALAAIAEFLETLKTNRSGV
jgi:PilZ domain-containing protein